MSERRRPPCMLTVEEKIFVNDRLLRLVFSSEGLLDFPKGAAARHIKLFFPKPHQKVPVLPVLGPNGPVWPPAPEKPIPRTYSVRGFDEAKKRLAVEFVVHGEDSVGSTWAHNAKPGDKLGLAGPGGPDPIIEPSEYYILAGDLSAIPAISAVLENLPVTAQGKAFIHVSYPEDRFEIARPEGIEVIWVHSPETLIREVQNSNFAAMNKRCSAFVAGESSEVLAIRDYLRAELGLTRKSMYAIPYWRRRQNEEAFHEDRHRIMDEEY
jgi:NADPH-dependent ferric siderophore reductase